METVNSILSQSYSKIEVLVISDGGKDDTERVLNKVKDKRLKYISLKSNHGRPAVPRNVGIKACKGDFIAFCDDDDIWFKKKLEHQLSIFKNRSNILIACSNGITFPTKNDRVCVSRIRSQLLSYNYCLNNKNIIINSSVLMKRKVIESVGYLDEDINLKAVEDFDYWLRVLKHKNNSIYYDVRILLKYRVFHDKIMVRAHKEQKTSSRLIKILQKHLPLSSKRINVLERIKVLPEKENESIFKLILVSLLTKYIKLVSRNYFS